MTNHPYKAGQRWQYSNIDREYWEIVCINNDIVEYHYFDISFEKVPSINVEPLDHWISLLHNKDWICIQEAPEETIIDKQSRLNCIDYE